MEITKEQWEAIELLEGISEDRKEMVAHAMTLAFNWIDKQSTKDQDELLPLETVRRIATSIDLTDEQILEICEEVGLARDKFDFSPYADYPMIDAECEFQFIFCDNKISELKNSNI